MANSFDIKTAQLGFHFTFLHLCFWSPRFWAFRLETSAFYFWLVLEVSYLIIAHYLCRSRSSNNLTDRSERIYCVLFFCLPL